MNIAEVKAYLAETKDDPETKAFLEEIAPKPELTIESVTAFLSSDEGVKIVKTHPVTDQRVTDAIKKFEEKQRPVVEAEVKRRVAEEVMKLNPSESPEQKRIRELEQSFEAEKSARAKTEMLNQLNDYAREQKADISKILKSGWIPPSLEEGKLFVQQYASEIAELKKQVANETIAANAHKPGSGQNNDRPQIDTSKLTFEQAYELEMSGKLNDHLRGRSA